MGIVKRAADLVYTIRFLTLLVTPFDKTTAFELGIIDEKGKKNKNFDMNATPNTRAKYKDAYTPFHRLVFNIKRLMGKVPGGSSRIASYAAALYLIKENYSVSEKRILKALKESVCSGIPFPGLYSSIRTKQVFGSNPSSLKLSTPTIFFSV